MQVNYEIEEERLKHGITDSKRRSDTKKTTALRNLVDDIQACKRGNQETANRIKIDQTKFERDLDTKFFSVQQQNERDKQDIQIDLEKNKKDVTNECKKALQDREAQKNTHKLHKDQVKAEQDIKEINAEAERAGIKANFEMKKASIADATQLQMLKLKTVKEIHSNGSFSSVYLNHTDD